MAKRSRTDPLLVIDLPSHTRLADLVRLAKQRGSSSVITKN